MPEVRSQIPFRVNSPPAGAPAERQIQVLTREVNRVLVLITTAVARLSGDQGQRVELAGPLDMNDHEIFGLADPSTDESATHKEYVDTRINDVNRQLSSIAVQLHTGVGVQGVGTTNTVSKFTAPSVIGNSSILDDGAGVVSTTSKTGFGLATNPSDLEVATTGSVTLAVRSTDETSGGVEIAKIDFLAGTGAVSDTTLIGRIAGEIVQADPGTLKGRVTVRINEGDNTARSITFTETGGLGIGTEADGTSAERFLAIRSGAAPSTAPTDVMQVYSGDESAGNACFHTRSEGGDIVKLYQEAALTAEDGATVDATYGTEERDVINNLRTRLGELETALQNLGLLA